MDKSSSGKEMVPYYTKVCGYCHGEIRRDEPYHVNYDKYLGIFRWIFIHKVCYNVKAHVARQKEEDVRREQEDQRKIHDWLMQYSHDKVVELLNKFRRIA